MGIITTRLITRNCRQGHPRGHGARLVWGTAKGPAKHVIGERFKEYKTTTEKRTSRFNRIAGREVKERQKQRFSKKQRAYDECWCWYAD